MVAIREVLWGIAVERRDYIRSLAVQYKKPELRAQRIFLEVPSFAVEGKKEIEFDIKTQAAEYFSTSLRSVVFCGSAHLGFSPFKEKQFCPGQSDLDVAVIGMVSFQEAWMALGPVIK